VAEFFGVADLTDAERMEFLDYWLTRAAKTHSDDLLLNQCRKTTPSKRTTTPMTATGYRLSQPSTDPGLQYVSAFYLLNFLIKILKTFIYHKDL